MVEARHSPRGECREETKNMLLSTEVCHEIFVPYPKQTLIEQFFDFEHLPYVHPKTLGKVAVQTLGHHWVIGDLSWTLLPFVWLRSKFCLAILSPDELKVDIVEGWGKGSAYHVKFSERSGGTEICERLIIPGWQGVAVRLAKRQFVKMMRRIWEEDLAVKMCHGGWPGIEAVGLTSQYFAEQS